MIRIYLCTVNNGHWINDGVIVYLSFYDAYTVIKSPQSGVTLCSFPLPPPQWLLLLASKPFKLNLRYLGQRKYRSGKMYWMTFWWPWPKVTAVTLINKNLFVCRIKWEPLNQSLQSLVAIFITLVMLITWLDFAGIPLETLFFFFFFFLISDAFFSRSNTIEHISGMVGTIDVKRKGGASVGYWVNSVTLTFDLTHELDLWFWRSNFKIAVSQELLSDWCETKRKQTS